MSRRSPFAKVGVAPQMRSSFDLTHVIKTAFFPGQVVPLPPIDCLPGDHFRINFNGLIRLQPMVTPMFENMTLRFYSFFVPYRILDEGFEEFYTGGDDGMHVGTLPTINPASFVTPATGTGIGSLWDYFGWQVGLTTLAANSRPLQYPHRAYWMIYNEYFRVPSLQDEVDIETHFLTDAGAVPFYRNWLRDYYTSALPFTQVGLPPSLPVFGSTSAEFELVASTPGGAGNDRIPAYNNANALGSPATTYFNGTTFNATGSGDMDVINGWLSNNTVDGAAFSGADINDLRLAWQIQVWQERNARGGTRFTEVIFSHWRKAPRDERLQRPEFIGGSITNVVVSEVVQTSQSDDTPQGTMAGHGIGVPIGQVGRYTVEEPGLILNMVVCHPRATYQQGIPRPWLRRTKFDFPWPEFAHLGEQAIFNGELFMQNATDDPDGDENMAPFGYTGQYNEMRYLPDRVTGKMRDTASGGNLDTWNMARYFANLPELQDQFISMETAAADMMRPFAVKTEPPLLGILAIGVDAMRPLPFLAEPSQIGG